MKLKITRKHIGETSRKSRVKMHKSGKHWVKTLISQIGLIRLTGASAEQVKVTVDDVDTVTSKHSKSIALLKGIAATGGVVSGVGMLAHEVEAEDVTNANQSTQNDTVNLTETTVTTTVDATETAPTTVTEATTEAATEVSSEAVTTAAATEVETENNSESISQSLSESVSVSLSESVSLSVSESVSESISESVSESVSESDSESVSESVSASESELVMDSTSITTEKQSAEEVKESSSEVTTLVGSDSVLETNQKVSESLSLSLSEAASLEVARLSSEAIKIAVLDLVNTGATTTQVSTSTTRRLRRALADSYSTTQPIKLTYSTTVSGTKLIYQVIEGIYDPSTGLINWTITVKNVQGAYGEYFHISISTDAPSGQNSYMTDVSNVTVTGNNSYSQGTNVPTNYGRDLGTNGLGWRNVTSYDSPLFARKGDDLTFNFTTRFTGTLEDLDKVNMYTQVWSTYFENKGDTPGSTRNNYTYSTLYARGQIGRAHV